MADRLAGDFDYEQGGATYEHIRRADPTIAAVIHRSLGPAGTVLNVGAGAGSYEPDDRLVLAVEPSPAMRSKRPADRPPAIDAVAEQLPFDNDAFDAAMTTFSVHQWRDLSRGLAELRRVARGPVVILTADGDALARFWLAHYAPEVIETERRRYPKVPWITAALGGRTTVEEVPIPLDCTDGFGEAFYGRPEQFLIDGVRRAQSAWGFLSPEAEARAVESLARDLETGEWDRRHGHLRTQPTYRGSLRLITAHPGP